MKALVMGGGTFSPISNHLSLCAQSFGSTARYISKKLDKDFQVDLVLTKMAGGSNDLITNSDIEDYIDKAIEDRDLKVIVMSIAFCDFEYPNGNFHGNRLISDNGPVDIRIIPSQKIIDKIRIKRSDIFLIGFKTTTSPDDNVIEHMHLRGLKMMKRSKCNLVFVNDTLHRRNIIITPEESHYGSDLDRNDCLDLLSDIIILRSSGTYNSSILINESNFPFLELDSKMQSVLKMLIDSNAFICNNGNGFTPGHFCQKINKNTFVSSQRKADHNLVCENGLTKIVVNESDSGDTFNAYGDKKASVGARSQWLIFKENPDHKYIIHTHNPLLPESRIPVRSQLPYQCGSIECGLNTMGGLEDMGDGIKAVYLEKHGANIVFSEDTSLDSILSFISTNIKLGTKTI